MLTRTTTAVLITAAGAVPPASFGNAKTRNGPCAMNSRLPRDC